MDRFERLQRRLPGRLARVGYGREVYLVGNRRLSFALQPSPRNLFPGNYVIDEFPDAVRVRDWSGGGLFSRHAGQQFAQRRAMPRRPFLSAIELAVDAMSFCHCLIPYEKNTPPTNLRYSSASGQLSVFYPMRLVGVSAQPGLAVGFVLRVVPVEPDDSAFALEGQDVRGDAVQEPAVVADDDGASGEVLQRLFERAHRVHVQVVGGFVEQQRVRARFQRLRQMDPVAFAAG